MVENNQLEDSVIDKLVVIFKKVMQEISDSIKENKVIENLQEIYFLIVLGLKIKGFFRKKIEELFMMIII